MKEIELSTMVPGDSLHLSGFQDQTFIRVQHRQFDWTSGWNNILQVGLYQKGPDVSEVGSTWLDNLKEMRALRPFSAPEIHTLGGDIAFLANVWRPEATVPGSTVTTDSRRVISIPWMFDTRLLYYRRDLLAQAGVPEENAFATPEAMYDTLARLQSRGFGYPLGFPTGGLTIHNLASWVWGRGGHFRSRDYHKIALVEPEAQKGMLDFYRLHRFIDPATCGMNYTETNELFLQGKCAVMMNGQWSMRPIKEREPGISPQVLDCTGYAPPPGVPYIGSTHLVIWQHSLHEHEAIQLIGYLTSPAVLKALFPVVRNFPARVTALHSEPFARDPDYQLVIDCIRRGREIRSARLWAGIETRLNAMCEKLWVDLLANPDLDLPVEIERRTHDLASRLEKTLLANW
jgi:multiple sugar transport system substrate-binding protein